MICLAVLSASGSSLSLIANSGASRWFAKASKIAAAPISTQGAKLASSVIPRFCPAARFCQVVKIETVAITTETAVAKKADIKIVNQNQMPMFGVLLKRPAKNSGPATVISITHSIKRISRYRENSIFEDYLSNTSFSFCRWSAESERAKWEKTSDGFVESCIASSNSEAV